MKKLLIIGLGLIGGSIAKAVRRSSDAAILGADLDEATLDAALCEGAIDAIWQPGEETDADLVLLALRPGAAIDCLRESAACFRPGAVVSDVCGVKAAVVAACEPICRAHGLHYLGGHPMAGRECSGYANAVATLFENRSYILTPTPQTDPAALAAMRDFARLLGCVRVTETTPAHHDEMIAFTSQLPHVLAGAYIKAPAGRSHAGYSAGSFHDVSRVARVDEQLWSELFLLNRENLLAELHGLIERLQAYEAALSAADRQALTEILREARLCKERDLVQNGAEQPHPFG